MERVVEIVNKVKVMIISKIERKIRCAKFACLVSSKSQYIAGNEVEESSKDQGESKEN